MLPPFLPRPNGGRLALPFPPPGGAVGARLVLCDEQVFSLHAGRLVLLRCFMAEGGWC